MKMRTFVKMASDQRTIESMTTLFTDAEEIPGHVEIKDAGGKKALKGSTRGLRLHRGRLKRKDMVFLTVDKRRIEPDGVDAATVTFDGVPDWKPTFEVSYGDQVATVERGETLQITSTVEAKFQVRTQDRDLVSNAVVVIARERGRPGGGGGPPQ